MSESNNTKSIILTRFTATDGSDLAKRIYLTKTGAIKKESLAQFNKGFARKVTLEGGLQELPGIIDSFESMDCLSTGIFEEDKCRVIPRNAQDDGRSSFPVRHRTKEAMRQPSPGIALLDHDPSPRMPPQLKCMSPAQLMSLLRQAAPALSNIAWIGRGSSSSGIVNKKTGEPYSDSPGIHAFIGLNTPNLDQLKKYLEVRLWLGGLGYVELARNGRRLLRTVIDLSVLTPERLIFEASPILGPGVDRNPPEWETHQGILLEEVGLQVLESEIEEARSFQQEALNDPTLLEEAEQKYNLYREDTAEKIATRKGISKGEALRSLPDFEQADIEKSVVVLPGEHPIYINGEWMTFCELNSRADEFDGKSMPDPIEGPEYGTSTAIFYANADTGSPTIHSLAHGMSTTYVPESAPKIDDIQGLTERFEQAGTTQLVTSDAKRAALSDPLNNSTFPHLTGKGDSARPIATIENFGHLLKSYKIPIRYNVIAKETEINIPGKQGSIDNQLAASITRIESLAALNGMSASPCTRYLGAIADENQYNPIAEWIFSKPWDGVDRLPGLYGTLEVRDDYPIELRNTLLYRWLLSAVAAALKVMGFHSRGVLTLHGAQSIGKTSWIRNLVNDPMLQEAYVLEGHHLDPSNKDSVFIAVSHWIVELGELDSSFKKDVARIKGFLTNKADKLRKPYASAPSEYQRRTVFAASVNENNFLVDTTGNTRWWVVPVVGINYLHQINMQQVFAQLAVDFDNGVQWWLTQDEERQLEAQNQAYRSVSVIEEKILEELDASIAESDWRAMTATDVLEHLDFQSPNNRQARECGGILRRLYGEPRKIKGRTVWWLPLKKSC